MSSERHLVTSALPYANGPLHFGHLAGVYLPADAFVRHKRMKKEKVIHISGSDEHGVAIMLNANKAKRPYKEYVDEWHAEHKALMKDYEISFDFFGQTSAKYHEEETLKWFKALHDKEFIEPRDEEQLQCLDCKNMLPDRFVEGECYECHFPSARGDECPQCGIIIDPLKLINPVCKICSSKNIKTTTVTQYYLKLTKYEKEFNEWFHTKKNVWRKTVYPFVESLNKDGMVDRAITRNLDWGIDVPLPNTEGKKLYVWFDAPIGYVSNTKEYLKVTGSKEDYLKDWWNNPETKIYNFLAKDNIIFHSIIFPVMSMAAGFVRPVDILPANQFLNLQGKQFSKSTGWYIDSKMAVDKFGPNALRYYLISILPEYSDSSFTWEGFQAKVNGELSNNIGNLVSRCLKFWQKNWSEGIDAEILHSFLETNRAKVMKEEVLEFNTLMDSIEIKSSLEHLMKMGQSVNTYFTELAPWSQFKVDQEVAKLTIAHASMEILVLATLFEPLLPNLSSQVLSYFSLKSDNDLVKEIYAGNFDAIKSMFSGKVVMNGEIIPLVPKIDDAIILELNLELKK
jgi:methionyl-tRNA synthetase